MTARPGTRLRLLLVEDNAGDAFLIEEFVGTAVGSFDLRRAKTMAEGLRLLADFAPQVVLLDLNLPDSKGVETVATFCRGVDGVASLRPAVLVLTSLDDHDAGERAIELGAEDYLVKGDVNAKKLVWAVRRAVQRQGRAVVDRMLEAGDGHSGEAIEVLGRVNRAKAAAVAIRDAGGTAEQDVLGAQAAEAAVKVLDHRVGELESGRRDDQLRDARREATWATIEKLVVGNGKGPLRDRLAEMERKLDDLVLRAAAPPPGPGLRASLLRLLGWLILVILALLPYFVRPR